MIRTRRLRKVFFFTHPSFMRGMARIVDPFGQLSRHDLYNFSSIPDYVDYQALRSDWEMVGRDLKSAIRQYSKIRGKASHERQ